MVKINDYLNIKIYRYRLRNQTRFFFFKDNYLIAYITETENNIIFIEDYDNFKFKKRYNYITNYIDLMYEIKLYEFIFSNDANRLFLNRAKPITYQGIMRYALKIDKELKEYFQNIIENE